MLGHMLGRQARQHTILYVFEIVLAKQISVNILTRGFLRANPALEAHV